MKGYKLPTAVEQRIYLDAEKTIRGMLRKLKKRKVAEFNQEHEKITPDDNEGKQDKGSTQNKTQPTHHPAFKLYRFERRRHPRLRPLRTLATGVSASDVGTLVQKYRFFKLKAFADLPAAMKALGGRWTFRLDQLPHQGIKPRFALRKVFGHI